MQSDPGHSGDLSQDSPLRPVHRSRVTAKAFDDPASRRTRGMYNMLSASSIGLELGLAVLIGLLFGIWLDSKLGTEPWLMLVFLGLGFTAGFRGVLRAVHEADKEGARG